MTEIQKSTYVPQNLFRPHSGDYRMYSTAITSHYKIFNPCVLNRKSLQFCSDTHQMGQQLWTQWSPAATATPSSKNSWSRLVVRALAQDYRRPRCNSWLLTSKLSFSRSAPASAWKLSLGTQWVIGGCWSRLRHVSCWVCRAAQAPKACRNECQANQSSVSGWSPLRCPHTDIQCHLKYPWLSCLASSSYSKSAQVSWRSCDTGYLGHLTDICASILATLQHLLMQYMPRLDKLIKHMASSGISN